MRGFGLLMVAMVLSSCGWKGIANVPLPFGPGSGSNKMTIYVQMPDTLALNVNSRVRVADVYVGSVKKIELKNWIPTLTLDIDPGIKPGQCECPDRPNQSPGHATRRTDSAGQPVVRTAAQRGDHSAEERVGLPVDGADIGEYFGGAPRWGIPNLEVIQTEVANILSGNAEQIRDFLGKLNTFTDQLNQQRADLTRPSTRPTSCWESSPSETAPFDRVRPSSRR